MCFSAQASFTAAALLTAGGIYCLRKARPLGKAYLPLALFPLIVGIQQTAEGLVWTGFALENRSLIFTAALSYLFFVWMVWPVWVPYMTARLEPGRKRRTFFYTIAAIGILLGLQFYLPLFQGPEWFDVVIKNHSISYQCKLITQPVLPRYSLTDPTDEYALEIEVYGENEIELSATVYHGINVIEEILPGSLEE